MDEGTVLLSQTRMKVHETWKKTQRLGSTLVVLEYLPVILPEIMEREIHHELPNPKPHKFTQIDIYYGGRCIRQQAKGLQNQVPF